MTSARLNILMVDDQPAKLLSYETILQDLGENLIRASSAREALEQLLKTEIAIVLMDVSMPEIDGFELADLIRQHPRYQKTAIIFVSAVRLSDLDRIKGYAFGAVDYISVPVIPEILRAKVGVFAELYRTTHQLEQLNQAQAQNTAELHLANQRLEHELTERARAETALRTALHEKEVLLKEIHHRVKNNLQVIVSMLRLQSRTIADASVRELLRDSQNRVHAMALVHAQLYQAPDLARIDVTSYLRSLATSVLRSYEARAGQITLILDLTARTLLDIDRAIPLGLILTELVSNSVKHGFNQGQSGTITIRFQKDSAGLLLSVCDDGVGLPASFGERASGSLGLFLVNDLAEQLGGSTSIDQSAGTNFQIHIPYSED